MTNEEAIKNLKKLKSFHNGSYGTAIDMAIKALEQQPRDCKTCIHSEERDGSNCYECIKGMSDNFEEQPKTSYISIDVTKFAKEVAEKALDEITYEGKTVREWVEIIVNQQQSEDCRNCKKWNKCPCGKEGHENGTSIGYSIGECKDYEPCEDCVSREQALLALTGIDLPTDRDKLIALFTERIQHLPSVTPTNEDIKEAYLKGYDYGVKDWFKSKTQPCEDAVSREAVEEITFQEPSYTDPYNILTEVREKVRALKPVQPKRKVNIDGLIATLEIDAENSAGGFGDGIYSAIEVIKDYFGGGEEDVDREECYS